MPAILLRTSVPCDSEKKNTLAAGLSKICASDIGKPESYVMSLVEDDALIYFGGQAQASAFVEVRSIGDLNPDINVALSSSIGEFLAECLDIDLSHVYINFSDIAPANWGWNGGTF